MFPFFLLQRFNVMMTRAKSLLIIVGDHASLDSVKCWNEQIKLCQELGSLMKNGRKLYPRICAP